MAEGISEAEAGYTRRLTAAKMQGRSIEEVEKNQTRNVLKEVKKRVQVRHKGLPHVAERRFFPRPFHKAGKEPPLVNSMSSTPVFPQSISEAQAMISKSRSRITTAEQELAEIRRRESNDRALKHQADGLVYLAHIREAHRYDWTRRYTAAMSADEDSEETLEVRLDKPFPRLF